MLYTFWVKRGFEAPEMVKIWAPSESSAQLTIDKRYGRNVYRVLAGVNPY